MERSFDMGGELMIKRFEDIGVTAYLPEEDFSVALWTFMHGDEAENVISLFNEPKPAVFCVEVDWNRELSPWSAKAVFGDEDFSGGADDFIKKLVKIIIPAVEKSLNITNCKRIISGYSLAGLFSVYAFYKTDVFDMGASVSGSLWFDGFIEFMKNTKIKKLPEKMYFSVGSREKKTKNIRMATVEDRTKEAEKIFCDYGSETVFELNAGGHFNNVPERIAFGINCLTAK